MNTSDLEEGEDISGILSGSTFLPIHGHIVTTQSSPCTTTNSRRNVETRNTLINAQNMRETSGSPVLEIGNHTMKNLVITGTQNIMTNLDNFEAPCKIRID